MPLRTQISFVVASVRRNNGVIDTLLQLPGQKPDEYVQLNLMIDRGVPKVGERYVLTITPEFPTEA